MRKDRFTDRGEHASESPFTPVASTESAVRGVAERIKRTAKIRGPSRFSVSQIRLSDRYGRTPFSPSSGVLDAAAQTLTHF